MEGSLQIRKPVEFMEISPRGQGIGECKAGWWDY
jgi:hypothetical protein